MPQTPRSSSPRRDGPLPKGRSGSTGDEAYQRIREEILEGRLWPGDVVVEGKLAESLNISRTPIREALMRLERENLLQRAGRSLAVRVFTSADVSDIFGLRAEVEAYGARLAAERMLAHEFAELAQTQRRMVEATDIYERESTQEMLRRITQLNLRFHRTVVTGARSPALERTIEGLVQTPLLYRAQQWYDATDRRESIDAHDALLKRVVERDADGAARVWRDHLLYARDTLVARLADSEMHSALTGDGAGVISLPSLGD